MLAATSTLHLLDVGSANVDAR